MSNFRDETDSRFSVGEPAAIIRLRCTMKSTSASAGTCIAHQAKLGIIKGRYIPCGNLGHSGNDRWVINATLL